MRIDAHTWFAYPEQVKSLATSEDCVCLTSQEPRGTSTDTASVAITPVLLIYTE